MLFSTEYRDKNTGRLFGGEIEAKNRFHAWYLSIKRGLKEKLNNQKSKSYFQGAFNLFSEDADDCTILHEVVYVTYLGLKSGKISVDEALSDSGYLHDLIHYMIDSDISSVEPIEDIWSRLC